MADIQEGYREQIKKLMDNLSNRAKIIIIIAVISILIIFVTLIFWSSNDTYKPLFTQLTSQDASAIVSKLKENNTSYKLDNNGTTIMVPQDRVYDIRLQMAGEGLPSQGVVGFEIFDNSQFGTTDFERKVNYYRAIGGELSRSIRVMNGVDYARVQITAPRESLYTEQEQPASASVLLKLNPGFRIRGDQITSIGNLVASSVQGLSPENVTIVDTAGNLLSSISNGGFDNQGSIKQLSIQKKFEEALKANLRSLLTKVLGPDNFTIQVRAELNFDQKEVESKTYSPVVDDEGIVRSKEKNEENYEGGTAGAEGVPGTESNIPQYQQQTNVNNTNSSYEKENSITNYEINEKIERHNYAAGDVKKLSVSIIVDDSVGNDAVRKIGDSVKAAIGYDEGRGDQINITSIGFDNTIEQEVAAAQVAEKSAQRRKMYIYGGLIALVLIIITILIVTLSRSTGNKEEYVPGERMNYTVGEKLDEAEESAEEFKQELSDQQKKRKKMKDELEDVITNQPENAAQLLKSWLIDE